MPEKKTVSAREVVADIRVGMTDAQLMAKYGLAEKGLESLKKKLLAAGLIVQAGLDGIQNSGLTASALDKKALARNIAEAVRSGLPDDEIVKKFGISAAKLPGAYASLIKVGYLTQGDLDSRQKGLEQTVESTTGGVASIPEDDSSRIAPPRPTQSATDVLPDFAQRFSIPREDLERLKTASIKDIKAFFEKHNIPWSEGMDLVKALGLRASDFVSEAADTLKAKAKDWISKAEAQVGVEKPTVSVQPAGFPSGVPSQEGAEVETNNTSWGHDKKIRAVCVFAALTTGISIAQVATKSWFWFIVWAPILAVAAIAGYYTFLDRYKGKIKYVVIAGIIFTLAIFGNWGKSVSTVSHDSGGGHPSNIPQVADAETMSEETFMKKFAADAKKLSTMEEVDGPGTAYIGKKVCFISNGGEINQDSKGYYRTLGFDPYTKVPHSVFYFDPQKSGNIKWDTKVGVAAIYKGKVRDITVFDAYVVKLIR